MKHRSIGRTTLLGLPGIAALLFVLYSVSAPLAADTPASQPLRRIYAPDFRNEDVPVDFAVFWFGQVDDSRNYADLRVRFQQDHLQLYLHIFDHWLWYSESPDPATLTNWDAVSLYLHVDGAAGAALTDASHRFITQVKHWQPDEAYQRADRGASGAWLLASTPFTTTTGWRGSGFNGATARGWLAGFTIPYASLGLPNAPAVGTTWRLALAVHDRDDEAGTPLLDQTWPETIDSQRPSSWGELVVGLPTYLPPHSNASGTTIVRHGFDGVEVKDAHVGGHSVCGSAYDPNYFNGWGDANYSGYEQINIQNQWDVADWPCFSKYYVTFPLETMPAGKSIISATLTLRHFGNAFPAEASPSYIQVMTVADDWNEATITWNNAPLATENFGGAWVPVLPDYPGWPGIARHWDVSLPVVKAYEAGEPLRLALYSADGDYHSGKYFFSSDADEAARPELRIVWGAGSPTPIPSATPAATTTPAPTTPPTAEEALLYLPLMGAE